MTTITLDAPITVTLTLEQLLEAIQQLDAKERLIIMRELGRSPNENGTDERSILSLRGLGKEVWADVDANEYIEQERDSWNG